MLVMMIMVVRVRVIMVMMAVTMMVMMIVIMPVRMLIVMLMMMDALARPRPARIFAEHQRFDGHRHGVGRHTDAAEIDVVEIPQHDAIDD
jgi:hypothetical protein